LLTQLAVAPINHVLRGESWALRRLAEFAGRTARFDVLPFSALVTVRDSGEIAPAASGATPDVHIRLTPAAAARILAGDLAAYDQVAVDGDGEFAQALQFVARNARWDVEEDLARVVGDTLAHRAVGAGRAVLQLQARAAASLARNLSDYWLEERPLIARRADVADWVHEVDRLRDDVERLAQRIARL
jgi:ubiquinone biosynthesis protein UbiJ